jgi:cytochrome c biogenesis protein CcmG/thiol:disulfide interchange protein DsbE
VSPPAAPPPRRARWLVVLPVIAFAGLVLLFWKGLGGDPNLVPSALIGRPAPDVTLPAIDGLDVAGFDTAALRQGGVTLVNVWASWCVPCRDEHPVLMELSKRTDIRLVGIDYKDDPDNARRFLVTLGQPFAALVADRKGSAAINWGVYGVPETFVIDGAGIIRYKFVGPMTPEAVSAVLEAEIAKARRPLAQ